MITIDTKTIIFLSHILKHNGTIVYFLCTILWESPKHIQTISGKLVNKQKKKMGTNEYFLIAVLLWVLISKSDKSVSLVRKLKPVKYKDIQIHRVKPVRKKHKQVDRTLGYDEIKVLILPKPLNHRW